MEEEFMDTQNISLSDVNRSDGSQENGAEIAKDLGEPLMLEENLEDEENGGGYRGRGRGGTYRGRGRGLPPPGWMNGPPPMRFRGRGYGPGGPPMRGRGFFRGRGGPRFNNGPNFDNNWGPMGPPPPGMMGGPPPYGPPPGMMPPGGPMGPPPNMMGQPPPFGGPPGMPPPNMPAPELWVETKSEEGKSYYYHSRTRETTWTRPQEGPTCKVITQAEMEAMANNPYASSQAMPMGGPMGGPPMGGPPMGMMPNGMMGAMMPPGVGPQSAGPTGPTGGAMPPYMTQPPPWMNKDASSTSALPATGADKTKDDGQPKKKEEQTQHERDAAIARAQRLAKISKVTGMSNPAAANMPPPVVVGAPMMNMTQGAGQNPMGPVPGAMGPVPGAMGPGQVPMGPVPGAMGQGPMGPGAPGMGPGPRGPWNFPWAPPIAAQPSARTAAALPDAGAATQQTGQPLAVKDPAANDAATTSKSAHDTRIPSALAARAAEWTTHTAPDGRVYYYHAGRQESVWDKPKCVQDLEDLLTQIAVTKNEQNETTLADKIKVEEKIEVIDVEAHAEAAAAAEEERAERERAERERAERERAERERAEREKAERERADKEKEAKEKAKADRSRPKTSMPISGTPWCVVWTGDGRVFFYNPTANSSVWERPAQLVGRADVDKAISQPPDALLDTQKDKKENVAEGGKTKGTNGELKRSNDSDDSDAEPTKKPKIEVSDTKENVTSTPATAATTASSGAAAATAAAATAAAASAAAASAAAAARKAAAIDAGKDAAKEAEIRAARVRAIVPFEQRVASFLQLLHESDVSAFSPWEKELHKIVFDSSYLLLNTKERKQVFDRYVRERAEIERKEKNNRLQQKKNDFRALMDEAKLHSKSSFTDFSSKYGRDERFKAIEKLRDRKTYFNEYVAELRKREKEDKDRKRDQVKADFLALLKEKAVDRHARWLDVKKKVDTDPRYKAVESSTVREDYFREYCKLLKEERKKDKDSKEKERDRSASKKDKKDKDKEKDKEKDKDKDREKEKEKEKDGKKDKKKEKGEQPTESAAEADDAHSSESGNEAEAEGGGERAEDEEARARERSARAAASIKEREKEVQLALASSLRDRDKEREYHKRDEAVQHLNALLADLVRNPDLTWREAKKQLKKDHRYALAKPLSKDDMERLFSQHTLSLAGKRREKLHALLTELSVPLTATWRDVKKQLEGHANAPVYASVAQMEREFRDYVRDRVAAAKAALRQLLQETRALTLRTHPAARQHPPPPAALAQLRDTLARDARYTALEHISDQREAIIMSYLEELQQKGPPPPPTASEPARRGKQ